MAMRKIEDSEIRKIFKHGDSRAITLPAELLRELGWRDNQKLVAKKHGKGILIRDCDLTPPQEKNKRQNSPLLIAEIIYR